MGGGTYSTSSSVGPDGKKKYGRADVKAQMFFASADSVDIFKQTNINGDMDPSKIKVRESRDSKEHPLSLAILLALDVTGSMGSVPHQLIKDGLPNIMGSIIERGINDPQVLFLGVGDHECGDRAPLQVGQFESSDSLLDRWLSSLYIEGGGGGNAGESYLLAWLIAARYTSIDCFEKRKEKGFLFTVGDEPCLTEITKNQMSNIMGEGQYDDVTAAELLKEARKTYNVFHIIIGETQRGSEKRTHDSWKQLLGDNVIIVKKHEDVAKVIADTISKHATKSSKEEVGSKEDVIL